MTTEIGSDAATAAVDEDLVTPARPERGYQKLYYDTVLQADQGCDFDFLQGK